MPRNEKGQFTQSENPREYRIEIRMDSRTKSMLSECSKALSMTRSDVIRKGIETVYNGLK